MNMPSFGCVGCGAARILDADGFCRECSGDEDLQRCRICGCTDDHACPGGCSWVDDDLCSRCA